MIEAITSITSNLGVSFENIIFLILLLGGFIFYAKSVQLGLLTHLLLNSGLFIIFYAANLNYTNPLVMVFISIVMLAFTLLLSEKQAQTGAVI